MKKVIIPIFLAAMAFPLCLRSQPIGLNAEFIGEQAGRGNENDYVRDFGIPTNNQMADEGFVLLKNDGSLPLEEGAKVSIVGKASINLSRGGAGSGAGSISQSVKNQFANGESDLGLDASLKAAGFDVNATATSFYKNASGGRTNGNDGWKGNSEVTIGETPIASVTGNASLMASLDEYSDAILQVITREGSEGCDVKTCNAHDSQKTNSSSKVISDRHALQLSQNEEDLFNEIKQHTDHVIIIINSSNVFECDVFEQDEKVSGVLWIGNPGDVGPLAVGRILSGEVNPSGHTADTWARDFTLDPTFQNFSDNAQTNKVSLSGGDYYAPQDTMFNADGTPLRSYGTDKSYNNTASPRWDSARGGQEAQVVSGGINGVKPSAYVSYEEGIYVDYRYYETRYADMAKEDKDAADTWYDGEEGVVYPFGYGLSYTTFDQKIVRARINPNKGNVLTDETDLIEISVKVTNTGDVAGKDVVQLYWKAPYEEGGIEKADHVLCAFDKTKLLEPNESQIVHLTFHLQDVANYDFSDANDNEFAGYELDPGEYSVLVGKNAHEFFDEVKFEIEDDSGIQYKTDRFTGNEVKNRFTDRGFYNSLPGEDDIEFTQMSRADFEGTFPTHPTIEDRTVKAGSRAEEFLTHRFSIEELDDGNFEYVPEAAYKTEEDAIAGGWEQQSSTKGDIQLNDMKDVAWEDEEAWNEFINQFSWSDMLKITETNGMRSQSISAVGKNGYSEGDGPQKFNIIWWVSSPIVAATFNPQLAHKQGECVGMESHISGKAGWWGSAVNTHRSPFGGRNFEYYSADPFLMGRIAAEVNGTATDRGVYTYFKHFAVNDQEKNRESGISYLTEQALREIYLKSFQMVFEEGKAIGVMASYNRLGLMETAASYPLLTEVLRGEWGFKGSVLSDMTHSSNGSVDFKCYENVNNRVLAGCNAQLDQGGGFGGQSEAKWDNTLGGPAYTNSDGEKVISYSYWYATREAVKGHMYMGVHSTGQFRGLTKVDAEKVIDVEIGEDFEFDVAIDVELSDDAYPQEVKLNDRIDLPKGIEFKDGVLSGAFEEVGLYRFDLIVTTDLGDEDNPDIVAVKLVVNAVPSEDEIVEDGDPIVPVPEVEPDPTPVDPVTPDSSAPVTPSSSAPVTPDASEPASSSSEAAPAKKKGCGGDIASVGALIGLISLAGIGFALLAISKKKRA